MWETLGAPDEDGGGEVAAFPTDMEDGEEEELEAGPTEDIRLPPRRRRRRRRRETSSGRRRRKRRRRSRYTH